MKVIIVDNNDSFTWNIIDIFRKIKNAEHKLVPTAEINLEIIHDSDHVIISPGPMKPADWPNLKYVIDSCLQLNKPLLGICLGHQAICEYFGGDLQPMRKVVHGQKKKIDIDNSSAIYKGLPSSVEAGLYHSWYIRHNNLPDMLKITGMSEDGCLMSVEVRNTNLFGIQFHPESFMTPFGIDILKNFLKTGS